MDSIVEKLMLFSFGATLVWAVVMTLAALQYGKEIRELKEQLKDGRIPELVRRYPQTR